jgi:DNA-binding transcriptional LysR family regulator
MEMMVSDMPDSFTLDQLRTFVSVHEAGNFSAAARRLKRAQSAVSTTMSNLEEHLGLTLWDRSTRIPTLTTQGRSILAAVTRVLSEIDSLQRLANDLVGGVETQLSLCVDALFPTGALVQLVAAFERELAQVELRVDVQTMSAVSACVFDGAATIGVVTPMGLRPDLERRALTPIRMVTVVSPQHPLAKHRGRVATTALADCVQIVLTERHGARVADQAVLSPRTWRVTDLGTKRALLLAGIGWGNLPEHVVRADLARRTLLQIRPEAWGEDELRLGLYVVYRRDLKLGHAHRYLLSGLEQLCSNEQLSSRKGRRASSG